MKYELFHILFVIKTPLRGTKDPLKFASLPTCGFVAQLVERPTSIWEARVQAPSKPEFFSGFFFCNFFNCSLPARINSSHLKLSERNIEPITICSCFVLYMYKAHITLLQSVTAWFLYEIVGVIYFSCSLYLVTLTCLESVRSPSLTVIYMQVLLQKRLLSH